MNEEPPLTRVLLVGCGWFYAGFLAIVSASVLLGATVAPGTSSWAFIAVGALLAWPWWSFIIPRWWRWALAQGANPYMLQNAGERVFLLWPRGSWLERTEFGNRWSDLGSGRPSLLSAMRPRLLAGGDGSEFGIAVDRQPWGVIKELGFPIGSITIVVLADGTCSVYHSNGGGVVGAGGHEAVGARVDAALEVARSTLESYSPITDLTLPRPGEINLFLLTAAGVRGARGAPQALVEEGSPAAPLFWATKAVFEAVQEHMPHG